MVFKLLKMYRSPVEDDMLYFVVRNISNSRKNLNRVEPTVYCYIALT